MSLVAVEARKADQHCTETTYIDFTLDLANLHDNNVTVHSLHTDRVLGRRWTLVFVRRASRLDFVIAAHPTPGVAFEASFRLSRRDQYGATHHLSKSAKTAGHSRMWPRFGEEIARLSTSAAHLAETDGDTGPFKLRIAASLTAGQRVTSSAIRTLDDTTLARRAAGV